MGHYLSYCITQICFDEHTISVPGPKNYPSIISKWIVPIHDPKNKSDRAKQSSKLKAVLKEMLWWDTSSLYSLPPHNLLSCDQWSVHAVHLTSIYYLLSNTHSHPAQQWFTFMIALGFNSCYASVHQLQCYTLYSIRMFIFEVLWLCYCPSQKESGSHALWAQESHAHIRHFFSPRAPSCTTIYWNQSDKPIQSTTTSSASAATTTAQTHSTQFTPAAMDPSTYHQWYTTATSRLSYCHFDLQRASHVSNSYVRYLMHFDIRPVISFVHHLQWPSVTHTILWLNPLTRTLSTHHNPTI